MGGRPDGRFLTMRGLSGLLLFVSIFLLASDSIEAAAAPHVRGALPLSSLQQEQKDGARGASSPASQPSAEEVDASLVESRSSSATESRQSEPNIPNGSSADENAASGVTRAAPLSPHQDVLPSSFSQPESSSAASRVNATESEGGSSGEGAELPEAVGEEGVAEPLKGQQPRPLTCDDLPCGEGQMTCKAITKGRFSCTCKPGYVLHRDVSVQPMCVKADSAGKVDNDINELFGEEKLHNNNKWAVGWAVFGLLVGGALIAAFVWAAVVFYKRSKSTESRHVQEEFTSLLTDKKSSIHSILANPDLRAQEVEQSGEEDAQRETPTESPRE
ncbi:hypothetical protein Emed_000169 [Eimeria media]